jgi:hypothetical protein
MNIPAFFVAALIPMIVGFIYYHKNVVGTPWMAVTGMTEEKAQEGNMALRFIVSYILSVLLAFALIKPDYYTPIRCILTIWR